jgi:hypothetical protein
MFDTESLIQAMDDMQIDKLLSLSNWSLGVNLITMVTAFVAIILKYRYKSASNENSNSLVA